MNPVTGRKRIMPKEVKQALIMGSVLAAAFFGVVYITSILITGGN